MADRAPELTSMSSSGSTCVSRAKIIGLVAGVPAAPNRTLRVITALSTVLGLLSCGAEAAALSRNWPLQVQNAKWDSRVAFDCGGIIGKVFTDLNRNGTQDEDETGLPDVDVVSVNGIRFTTDGHGRFNMSCESGPEGSKPASLVVKLDSNTLPAGFHTTGENPRQVKITRGKVTKLNFAVVRGQLVRFDLSDGAFEVEGNALKATWRASIDKLMATLTVEPSTLRMTYYVGTQRRELARKRVAVLQREIEARWTEYEGQYKLPIEVRIVDKNE